MFSALSKVALLGNPTLLSAILDDISEGVYIVSPKRQILFWNRGAEKITGYSAEEVTHRWCGDNILNHIDQDGNLLCTAGCPLSLVFNLGRPHKARIYARHKRGHRIPIVTHASPVTDEDGAVVAVVEVFHDATEDEHQQKFQERFQRVLAQYISPATMDEVLAQLGVKKPHRPLISDLTLATLEVLGHTSGTQASSCREPVESALAICEVVILRYHGIVQDIDGTRMSAHFIDANDAVAAGVKILHAIQRYNRTSGQRDIGVRIGISSGRIVLGGNGDKDRPHTIALESIQRIAGQIREAASPGELRVSETTLSRLKEQDLFDRGEDTPPSEQEPAVASFRYQGSD